MDGHHDRDVYAHALVLRLLCTECGRRWEDSRERWRVYFTEDDPSDCATYCPACARREFDD